MALPFGRVERNHKNGIKKLFTGCCCCALTWLSAVHVCLHLRSLDSQSGQGAVEGVKLHPNQRIWTQADFLSALKGRWTQNANNNNKLTGVSKQICPLTPVNLFLSGFDMWTVRTKSLQWAFPPGEACGQFFHNKALFFKTLLLSSEKSSMKNIFYRFGWTFKCFLPYRSGMICLAECFCSM